MDSGPDPPRSIAGSTRFGPSRFAKPYYLAHHGIEAASRSEVGVTQITRAFPEAGEREVLFEVAS